MDTRPLRVRLDLAKVNVPSYRRYVWYPVSPCALSTIAELKANICRKFNLPAGEVLLFVDGCLMQDEDTVLLLRENDVVQIVFACEYEGNVEPVYEDFMDLLPMQCSSSSSEIRRTRSVSDVTSERKKKKKKKKAAELNGSLLGLNPSSLMSPRPKSSKRPKLSKKSLCATQNSEELVPLNAVGEQEPSDILPVDSINDRNNSETIIPDENADALDNSESSCIISKHCLSSQNLHLPESTEEDNNMNVEGEVFGNDIVDLTVNTPKPNVSENGTPESQVDIENALTETKSANCKKRKRKRKRKRVKDQEFGIDASWTLNTEVNTEDTVNNTKNRQHIKFADSDQIVLDEQGRSQSLTEGCSSKTPATTKESVESEETSGSETEELSPAPEPSTVQKKMVKMTEGVDYSELPNLTTPPAIGSRIAFKILELSELYCPEVSSYKEGTVTGFDPKSDSIIIQLAKREMRQPRLGKFENIYRGQPPECELVQKIMIEWSALIDPKLMSPVSEAVQK